MTDSQNTLAEARAWVNRLKDSLPPLIDIVALGVKDKAPWMFLATREALIWRTEEIARSACDALQRDDFAVAAILTRAVTENAALTWALMDLLTVRDQYTPEELHAKLLRFQLGSRAWSEAPQAIQILNCIDKMDKAMPGVRACYDGLSDIVHPNWRGVFGMYSVVDRAELKTYFGRSLRGVEGRRDSIITALLGSLGGFEHAYNRISDLMPAYIAELESIWPEDEEPAAPRA